MQGLAGVTLYDLKPDEKTPSSWRSGVSQPRGSQGDPGRHRGSPKRLSRPAPSVRFKRLSFFRQLQL